MILNKTCVSKLQRHYQHHQHHPHNVPVQATTVFPTLIHLPISHSHLPVHPPGDSPPPAYWFSLPPVKPLSYLFLDSVCAVQGDVRCKSCNYSVIKSLSSNLQLQTTKDGRRNHTESPKQAASYKF